MSEILKNLDVGIIKNENITDFKELEIKDIEPNEDDYTYIEEPIKKKYNISSSGIDAANIVNPLAIPYNNIELTKVSTFRDDNFNKIEYVENRNDLSEDEKMLIFERGLNKNYSDALIKKKRIYNESLRKFSEDDSFSKYGNMLLYGVIDPTIILPYGGAVNKINSLIKAETMLTSMATKFASFGTVGAVTNVTSESLFQLQGLPTDYKSSAMIGFVLGGGIPAIADGFSFNIDKREISRNLLSQPQYEREIDTDFNIKQILDENGEYSHMEYKKTDEGETDFVDSIAMTEYDGGAIRKFGPDFMKASVNFLHEQKNKVIQNFVRKASAATVGTKDANGKLIKIDTTAIDTKIQYRALEFEAISKNQLAYKRAIKDGYFVGSEEDWNIKVSNEMRSFEAQRRRDIDSYITKKENSYIIDNEKLFYDELKVYVDNIINKKNNKISRDKLLKDKSILNKVKKNVDYKKKKLIEEKNSEFRKEAEEKFKSEDYYKDSNVKNGIKATKNFFDKYANEGKKIGHKDYINLDTNGLYLTRIYNWGNINKLDDDSLKTIFRNGIISFPSKNNKKLIQNKEKFDEELNKMVSIFKENASKSEQSEAMYIGRQSVEGITNVNHYMKNRNYEFDDYAIREILDSDVTNIIQKYNFRTSSELALYKHFGTSDVYKIQKNVIDELNIENKKTGQYTEKEIGKISLRVKNTLDNITGVSVMNATLKNPKGMKIVRMLGLFNTLTLGGKFGINSLNEIVNGLLATESKSLLIGKFGNNLKQIVDIMKGTDNDSFSREMMEMVGMLPELTDGMATSKITDDNTYFSGSFLEKGMRKGVDKLMTFNGMKLITGYFQSVVAANSIKDIIKFNKILKSGGTLSKKQLMLSNRWGLNLDDIKSMGNMIDKHAKYKDGILIKLNIAKWDDDSFVKMSTSIKRAVESGVLQGDTIHIPQWVIEGGPITKLAFEFLRYPIIAQEVLLRRGWTEDKGGLVASVAGAIMVFSSVAYLKEQADVVLGIKNKHQTKYDLFNSEKEAKQLILKSLNYIGALGALTIPYDKLATILGFTTFGREYVDDITGALGVSASRLGTLRQLLHGVLTGKIMDEQTLFALKSFLPFLSLPFISEGLNELIKEYGE